MGDEPSGESVNPAAGGHPPYAFTEHGALMAANAVKMFGRLDRSVLI